MRRIGLIAAGALWIGLALPASANVVPPNPCGGGSPLPAWFVLNGIPCSSNTINQLTALSNAINAIPGYINTGSLPPEVRDLLTQNIEQPQSVPIDQVIRQVLGNIQGTGPITGDPDALARSLAEIIGQMTPRQPPAPPQAEPIAVPEPGGLALLASGLAGLAGLMRRRSRTAHDEC